AARDLRPGDIAVHPGRNLGSIRSHTRGHVAQPAARNDAGGGAQPDPGVSSPGAAPAADKGPAVERAPSGPDAGSSPWRLLVDVDVAQPVARFAVAVMRRRVPALLATVALLA